MAETTKRKVQVDIGGGPGIPQLDKGIAGIGQRLKELNQAAQARGLSGDSSIFGLLKGAGAAAGVTFLARGIADAAEATKRFAEGAIDGKTALLEAGKAIPILGSLVGMGEQLAAAWSAIRANIDGSAAAMKVAADEAKRLKAETELAEQTRPGARDARSRLGILGLAGSERELAEEEEAAARRLRAEQDRLQKLRDEYVKTYGATGGFAPAGSRPRRRLDEILDIEAAAEAEYQDALKRIAEKRRNAQALRDTAGLGGAVAGARGFLGRLGGVGGAVDDFAGRVRGALGASAEAREADRLARLASRLAELDRTDQPEAQRLRGEEEQRQLDKELLEAARKQAESNAQLISVVEELKRFLFGSGTSSPTSPATGQPIRE